VSDEAWPGRSLADKAWLRPGGWRWLRVNGRAYKESGLEKRAIDDAKKARHSRSHSGKKKGPIESSVIVLTSYFKVLKIGQRWAKRIRLWSDVEGV